MACAPPSPWMPGPASASRASSGSQPSLTWDDLESLRTQLPSVRAVAPELRTSTQVFSEDQNWTTSVVGTTPDLFDIRAWTLAQGARFTDTDVEGGAKVAILGTHHVELLHRHGWGLQGPGDHLVGPHGR